MRSFLLTLGILGALGVHQGWFSLPAVGIAALVVFTPYLVVTWLSQPIRHRGLEYSDFPEFLGPWPESFDRDSRIFIEAESPKKHRLRFRVSGRGGAKQLRVVLPKRKITSQQLRQDLQSLVAQFEAASLREKPRSFDLQLPACAAYTGSLASRAAQAAFEALGYSGDARFTIWGEGPGPDPNYDLKVTEEAAELAPPGLLKKLFEWRASRIRDSLDKKRKPPGSRAV